MEKEPLPDLKIRPLVTVSFPTVFQIHWKLLYLMTQLRMDGWMDGRMNSNWVCLRFHLDFIYIKCFFVFGNFWHPRERKKRSQCYKGFFGEKKNGVCMVATL